MVTLRFILARIHYVRALLPLLTVKKIFNLLLSIGYFFLRSKRSVKKPPILILSITTDCNYNCIMCLKSNPKSKSVIDFSSPDHMDYTRLEKFLSEHADYLSFVRLHGGEPLYYKDILKLIDLLNELKIPYNIVTNASLLTEEMAKKFINSYCVGVGFSLDAATKKTYERMRVGGDWNKIISNINRLAELKRQVRSIRPVFSASMCAYSLNIIELRNLVKFCKEHEIPSLSVAEGIDQGTPGIDHSHLIENNIEMTHISLVEATKEAKEAGIMLRTRFPSLVKHKLKDIPYHIGKIKPNNCLNLYASAWILPNFNFIGCSAAKYSFGNLNNDTLDNIWNFNNSGYRGARQKFTEGKVPDACRECPYSGGFFT